MKRTTLTDYFTKLFAPENFDDYGPNGLQIEGSSEIKKIAFSVSASLEAIDMCIKNNCDTLVVHHGLFWKYTGAKPIVGPHGKRIKKIIKHDINLIAYHLPLDAHMEIGNAISLAQKLKLTKVKPFGSYKKMPLGAQGILPKPITIKKLQTDLAKVLNHQVIVSSPDASAKIKSVGIITGGANNEWGQALDQVDAYITGEISEYNWHDAKEAGIHYLAGGHHATEKFGIQNLMKKTKKDFPELMVQFFDSENPA
jgi:dinuclear metal center YbgI/SA1388 family protein